MFDSAKRSALEILGCDQVAEHMAARRCERKLRDMALSELPNREEIIGSGTRLNFNVPCDSPFPSELQRFKDFVAEGKLDALVARYPIRESRVFDAITDALKCGTRNEYQPMVLSRVRAGGDLVFRSKQMIPIGQV